MTLKIVCSRERHLISGMSYYSSFYYNSPLISLTTTPLLVRPTRPYLCFRLALLASRVSRRLKPEFSFVKNFRTKQKSMTTLQLGSVREDSPILVDKMTLGEISGLKSFSYKSILKMEWTRMICYFLSTFASLLSKTYCILLISCKPGKNTRISPLGSSFNIFDL